MIFAILLSALLSGMMRMTACMEKTDWSEDQIMNGYPYKKGNHVPYVCPVYSKSTINHDMI